MSRAPRQHRLPRRADYILIPAPLDLSLPLVTEKSPLPAIIVTPSSPSSTRDFSIAFLADPPKPSIHQRLFGTPTLRLRSISFLLLLIFLLVFHLVAHNLAARHGHLDLTIESKGAQVMVESSKAGLLNFWGVFGGYTPLEHLGQGVVSPDPLTGN